MRDECRDLGDLPASADVSLLVYHLSIGLPIVSEQMRSRTEPLAVAYHNITPERFYDDHEPAFAADLRLGREDLEHFATQSILSLADSEYNARDLRGAGHRRVEVVPAGLRVDRLVAEDSVPSIILETGRRFPNGYVVAVGQILPHKRIEQLIETVHLLNSTHWLNVGLVVCGVARQAGYFETLHRFRTRTAMVDVLFTGPVSDRELATYVRGSCAFLGMSDHEGLCIPPLEAAALGVPVVIKGAAAVPETMGGAGLVLPADAGPCEASEALALVLGTDEVRWNLIDSGYQRAAEFADSAPIERSAALLMGALG